LGSQIIIQIVFFALIWYLNTDSI